MTSFLVMLFLGAAACAACMMAAGAGTMLTQSKGAKGALYYLLSVVIAFVSVLFAWVVGASWGW